MYEEQRGNVHESSYNIGRAAHQLGLLHLAQHYYQNALAAAPGAEAQGKDSGDAESGGDGGVAGEGRGGGTMVVVPDAHSSGAEQQAASLNLSREIAHNLAIIYTASGAPELARELRLKYLTV